ncbi:MAG TPA: hypothetical protein DGQ94_00920, partial [Pseudomonas sp.]|nr:hypothetical protein [Pseudomonas sp.]
MCNYTAHRCITRRGSRHDRRSRALERKIPQKHRKAGKARTPLGSAPRPAAPWPGSQHPGGRRQRQGRRP